MKLIWRKNSLQDAQVLRGTPNPNPKLHLDGIQAICCCRRTCPEPSLTTSLSLSFSGPWAQPQDGGVILDASGSTDQHVHPQEVRLLAEQTPRPVAPGAKQSEVNPECGDRWS